MKSVRFEGLLLLFLNKYYFVSARKTSRLNGTEWQNKSEILSFLKLERDDLPYKNTYRVF